MFGIDDGIIGIGAGLLGGLFKPKSRNPYDFAKDRGNALLNEAKLWEDPNSAYYTGARQNNFNSLLKYSMNQNDLFRRNAMANGISSGTAFTMMGENNRKSFSDAGENANNFGAKMMGEGLAYAQGLRGQAENMFDKYGEGEMYKSDDAGSFYNNIIGLGGGLIGQYLLGSNNNINYGAGLANTKNINKFTSKPSTNTVKPNNFGSTSNNIDYPKDDYDYYDAYQGKRGINQFSRFGTSRPRLGGW